MPDVHAKLSASGAKKWMNCPGSVLLESNIPDIQSEYASEGTTAHSLGEAKLRLAIKEITRVKYHKLIKDLEITEDMESYTDDYRDFVIERFNAAKSKTPDAVLMLEQRLDFSQWVPEGFGTGDVVIIADGTMEIIDLKYGKGVPVYATSNPQLMLYSLGAISEYEFMYDIQEVTMTIFQPRIDNIDSHTLLAIDLLYWGSEINKKAIKAFNGSDECVAGKHCDDGFCKARAICRAYADERSKIAALDFKKPAGLSIEEIAEVIDLAERLATWSKLVKDYALDQAVNNNVKFPGFKLVEGRSNRQYSVDDTLIAAKLIGAGYKDDDIWPRKLKGITDLEKYLSKKTFNELIGEMIVKPQGKPTLVPVEDKRPELNTNENATNDFKEIIE
ncbi:MAG TPA: DUF2800 domain-containing protein [Clostridiales bacterium]|nr:DUF2800 domain-containing protein [Clostridiales bacterium]